MPSAPNRYASFMREVVVAVFVASGGHLLSSLSFRLFATSSLADAFVAMDSPAVFLTSFATIAVASGIISGLVLSIFEREHSVRIAIWAGLLTCALHFAIATNVGGPAWALSNYALLAAPCLAIGLVLGALLGSGVRHA